MRPEKRIFLFGTIIVALLGFAGNAVAGYSANIGGINVKYSKNGAFAEYDALDSTLSIYVWEDGGVLNVTASPSACSDWKWYADVYIWAYTTELKSIKMSGRSCILLFVTGQVGGVKTFSLKNGVVGGTDFYGGQGLGMSYDYLDFPNISIKSGFAIGPVLGVEYPPAAPDALDEGAARFQKTYVRGPAIDKDSFIKRLQEN